MELLCEKRKGCEDLEEKKMALIRVWAYLLTAILGIAPVAEATGTFIIIILFVYFLIFCSFLSGHYY